jgi:hypothetical protein
LCGQIMCKSCLEFGNLYEGAFCCALEVLVGI